MQLSPINLARLSAADMTALYDVGDTKQHRNKQYLCLADKWIRVRYLALWDGRWIVHDSNCDEYKDLNTFDEVYEILL